MPKKIDSSLWDEHYNSVCVFVEENKRLPEFHNDESEESKLGNWLRRMRSDRRTPLTAIQKEKLESIPGWYWSIEEVNERRWMENYEKVKSYYEEGLIPIKSSKDEEEKKLAEWCVTQRKTYKGKKMNDKKIYLLEQIPHWDWGFSQEIMWNEKFEKLKLFMEKEKRFPVHSKDETKYEECLLAFWCDDQKKNSKISEERKEKLQSIGFYN